MSADMEGIVRRAEVQECESMGGQVVASSVHAGIGVQGRTTAG